MTLAEALAYLEEDPSRLLGYYKGSMFNARQRGQTCIVAQALNTMLGVVCTVGSEYVLDKEVTLLDETTATLLPPKLLHVVHTFDFSNRACIEELRTQATKELVPA